MNTACRDFRSQLASVLSGRSADVAVGALAWHEHLLACGDCRALLEAEEALEVLLASLPEPKLPPELAERVLSRLVPARAELELDSLLDRSSEPEVPPDLARSVLAKLAAARGLEVQGQAERALDALLARVAAEPAPADLARRVLARLEVERDRTRRRAAQPAAQASGRTVRDGDAVRAAFAPAGRRADPGLSRGTGLRAVRPISTLRRVGLAASIALAIGASAWLWVASGPSSSPEGGLAAADGGVQPLVATGEGAASPAATPAEPPDDLLASLDLLESWELVTDDSLEAELTTAEDFDALLLGLQAQEAADLLDDAPAAPPTNGDAPPKKG